ncbi:MAG: hypothetical protein EBS23_10225 [Betaproteobacteria bacterium]|nr:hypothetical protein [Betaproteobacteria bacterium]
MRLKMQRLSVALVACWVPAVALAGANPLTGQTPAAPGGTSSYGAALKKEREIAECQRAGGVMGADGVCRQPEPSVLPRDGVTDELLEKYRIKK